MRKLFLVIALAIVPFGAVLAQELRPPSPAVEETIQSQIDAFLEDDFATAFTFASPSIQSLFGSPENFGAMVRNGYPMVWRPKSVRFGALRAQSGMLWQEVIVMDSAGRIHALEYQMVELDENWRIAGVRMLPTPDLSA